MKKNIFYCLLLWCILTACPRPQPDTFKPTPYRLNIPPFFPSVVNIPEDNPLTVEGVRLGRYLFYDNRLRGYTGNNPDSMMCCATCHIQSNAFVCGMNNPKFPNGIPRGMNGQATHHNMLPLCNLVFNSNGYDWNGAVYPQNTNPQYRNIEDIVLISILAENELYSSPERCINTLKNISIYPPMFKAAFGSEDITADRIAKAIAQFVRTLISCNSRFDQHMRGVTMLTDEELAGLVLFTTEEGADCFHCHGSNGNLLMTTNMFYNNGLDSIFTDPMDRYAVTGKESDKGSYRAPTLRNIALTAPYMHDGRYTTLDEVIDFYSEGLHASPYVHPLMHQINNGGVMLTPKEKQQLKAFLLTLTDYQFIQDTAFSKPRDLP